METNTSLWVVVFLVSFNFLASLINGNFNKHFYGHIAMSSVAFNFLASLINGNGVLWALWAGVCPAFNFLASLINGNHHY